MSSLPDFEVLFRASPNPYVLLDAELTIVEANEAYVQVTETDREAITGQHVFDVFPGDPDDPDDENVRRLRASFERVLEEGERDMLALIPYTISRRTPEGVVHEKTYWSATHTPILDEDGEVAFILQHTVNVTEVHELKEELKAAKTSRGTGDIPVEQVEESVFRRARAVQETNWMLDEERRHLRRLFDQAPGFMAFLRGPNHVFEMANEAYYQIIGHRDIVGKSVREALPEVIEQGFVDLLNRVYETGEPFVGREAKVQLQQEPGSSLEGVYLDFVYQPIVEPDGTVSGIFVQGHDVTEQKRTKDELRRYQDHLEELVRERTRELEESEAALRQAQKMEAIGQLTGGVAHDFNNLLQVIESNLELLQRDVTSGAEAADSEKARRRLQDARGAVERGAKLASQLLTFARRQPLEPKVIDPGQLLHEMQGLLRRTLDETIAIETAVEEDLWNTVTDPNQLENVILNLAINARDAMGSEGTLTVELKNAELDENYASRYSEVRPGRYVLLAISDTGCGMAPEDVERAFEPFFTTKGEDQGTGLGLSMAYGFVKQSGGHIKIYSEVGEGTTVKIYLPHTPETPDGSEETEPVSGSLEGEGETVLVVEDDAEVRAAAVEMLRDLGYHVLEAQDGEHALQVIRSGAAIDLLFTDVIMPGPVRSTDLAQQVQALRPDLKVLFTSGYTEEAIVHQGRLAPGVTLISKPYGRKELAKKIRQLLRGLEDGEERRFSGEVDARATVEERGDENIDADIASWEEEPPKEAALRILLVEDEHLVRRLASEAIQELGHRVVAVSSAEEAMETFNDERFDVLFTDVSLPGMSGLKLASELKRRDAHVQVVIASGYGPALETENGEKIDGAVSFLKPYTVEDLEELLGEITRKNGHSERV